jgi:hypothetical protein
VLAKKLFFFEKKNRKLFDFGMPDPRANTPTKKSLLLLFFRKEDRPYNKACAHAFRMASVSSP